MKQFTLCIAGSLMAWQGCAVAAQSLQDGFPVKPIRIVVTGVGSGGDFAARIIAAGISGSLGQQVIVENRTSGNAPAEIVSKAPADGYTLCLSAAPLWISPFLQKVAYDPVRDFAPVTLAVTSPNILVVPPSVAAKTVKELIGLIRAKPGQVNYATAGTGASGHLSAELFKSMGKLDMVRVNYKSSGQALTELIGGQVQLMFANAGAAAPHLKSGRLIALAVTSAQPSVLMPGLPTVASGGLPGYELVSIQGVFAPSGTPGSVIRRLNQEMVAFLQRPDTRERFLGAGVESLGSTPEALAATVKSEMARIGKVIKEAGIKAE